MLNLILLSIVAVLTVALIFARPLATAINYLLNFGGSHTGVRIIVRKQFSDVETGEQFQVWQGAYGIRVALASLLLKV